MAKHPGRSPVGCVQGGNLFLGKCEQETWQPTLQENRLYLLSNLEKRSFPTPILPKGEEEV